MALALLALHAAGVERPHSGQHLLSFEHADAALGAPASSVIANVDAYKLLNEN